jgi:hypothetical protein
MPRKAHGALEYWSVGFILSLRVAGYELRVMHCGVWFAIF